ncbi:MAG: hypothetical protein RLZZ165_1920 [Bacteroidota bacterium]|jgi:hypothetical protein
MKNDARAFSIFDALNFPTKKSFVRLLWGRLAYVAGLLFVLLLAGEITARLMGFRPWVEPSQRIKIHPGGSLYAADSLLGYRGRPGRYELRLQDSLDFTVTHDAEGWRESGATSDSLPQIWVLGCSFTHGFGVNDPETYVAHLQRHMPDYRVRNFGMDGYGTLQNWLLLRSLLRTGRKPALVVLSYGSFHDQRNTANRYWRKALHGQAVANGLLYPFIRLDDHDSLHVRYGHLKYHPLPLQRRLALMSLIEERWNRGEDHGLRSRYVTEALIRGIADASHGAGAHFVLAGVYRHVETSRLLRKFSLAGLHTVDISQDLSNPLLRILPGNGHPNAMAHELMADSLYSFLHHVVRAP